MEDSLALANVLPDWEIRDRASIRLKGLRCVDIPPIADQVVAKIEADSVAASLAVAIAGYGALTGLGNYSVRRYRPIHDHANHEAQLRGYPMRYA